MVQRYAKARILLYVLVLIYSLYMIYPFFWMIITSVKQSYELYVDPWALPKTIQWKNLAKAWNAGIKDFFANSVFITSVSVFFILVISSLASYAFARLKFFGKKTFFLILITGFLVPVQVTLIPLYTILRQTKLLDTYLAVIGPYIAYAIPFSVLLLTTYFKTIPRELEQAAFIDGANDFQIFYKIIMPLSKPGLATILIFQGVWIWNEFFFALVFIRSRELMTLPLGLMTFRGEFIADWPVIMAGIMISTIPLILLYLVFQRNFIEGLTAGAIKS
jgi:raffinose/stachyose/melibiose transport system permease protein